MSLPEIVSREDWLTARRALLEREKELTRTRDALVADRRRLPMVEITEDYRFTAPEGEVTLRDLFGEHRQLIVYHFMFEPEWEDGCPSCTAGVDELSQGLVDHLHARGTTTVRIARAPIEKLEAYRRKRGWPWRFVSSSGSTFNEDFGVTLREDDPDKTYNYRPLDYAGELPGFSCFLRDGDRVFHTYSTYARGCEQLGGSYYWLDMTALGRQEAWEEPKDRLTDPRPATPDFAV